MFRIFGIFITCYTVVLSTVTSYAYEPPRSALSINVQTGQTLFNEAASELRHPASLTKMMTLYMLFEALRDQKVTLETPVVGSRYSADRAPSRLGLAKDEQISVDLAIDALVVRSANDVAAAVAELLAGSEDAFAERMTVKARQLGMKDTVYRNASGLPNKEQVTTAQDQAVLGLALKKDFPEFYPRFSVQKVSYKDRTWDTHNNLLKKYDTINGIKTGFINASGFNIVTYSQEPNGDRLIVVMGGRSAKERDQVVVDLLEGRTPFHQLTEDQQIARTADLTKQKAAEKQELAKNKATDTQAKEINPSVEVAALEIEKPVEPETVSETPTDFDLTQTAAIQPYAIQVGALPTKERALERLALARPALKETNLRQYTVPLDTSRGVVFRARFIGFETMKAAFNACELIEKNKIECMALIQK
ncbi:MAG: D-alanyl-D-alanine carboxypeptidase family protein [Ahrensia sp.]|nr:D-alanyl-D-alanine carboxypeptidase family protein [Ahrensia sp.]